VDGARSPEFQSMGLGDLWERCICRGRGWLLHEQRGGNFARRNHVDSVHTSKHIAVVFSGLRKQSLCRDCPQQHRGGDIPRRDKLDCSDPAKCSRLEFR
jgi:hypothetical protein